MKKRFGLLEENSSSKQDSSTNQDISDIQDSSNNFDSSRKKESSNKKVRSSKQDSSRKQDSSKKQVRSSKQDSSINIKNIDPGCLMEKFSELYNKEYVSIEQSQAAREHAKEILDELLRVKAITKRYYNTLYKSVMSD